MTLCITLCTRGRPQMLARCLASLPPAIARITEPVFVVVVENDTTAQARPIVDGFASQLDILYEQEPEPGIPFARNRAVEAALSRGFDWLIFLDDDEWVPEDWLEQMLMARDSYPDAEVLTGPVVRDYPPDAPDWLPKRNRDHLATGDLPPAASTNNTCTALRLFAADGLAMRFEEKMRYTGGSDTEFFKRFTRQGGQIVWVDELKVYEEYSENRSTLKWHIARNVRNCSGGVLITRLHGQSGWQFASPRIRYSLYAMLRRTAKGTLLMLSGDKRGPGEIATGVLNGASAWGYIRGLLNLHPQPYRVIDGR